MFRILSFVPGTAAWHRNRMRRAMRGYRILRESSRLRIVGDVKHAITEMPLDLGVGSFCETLLGAAAGAAELAVRQYLLLRLGGLNLNRVLLMAATDTRKGIVYPMPAQWRRLLHQHGFRVSVWRCSLCWAAYVFAVWAHGVIQIFRIVIDGILHGRLRKSKEPGYAYFMNLTAANLPPVVSETQSFDIVSWYVQWLGRNPAVTSIRHGVLGAPDITVDGFDVSPQKNPFPPLSGSREIAAYLNWGLSAIVQSTFDSLRGRWSHALLLSQAALAAQVRCLPDELLAKCFLFHNSSWIYRPLWTYEAATKGADISMYFYSTNCETFKRPSGYANPMYGYRAMNWPRYLVWDCYQADFVLRMTDGAAQCEVVGPIWFQDKVGDISFESGVLAAIFDVTPVRSSSYRLLGLDLEYYVPDTVNAFLEHIWRSVSRRNGRLLWKRKREIGRAAHPKYRAFAECLGGEKNIMLVNPSISAIKVIKSANFTISLPFTSTALLAREMGKPSVYYDPTGTLSPDDRAAHGIPILTDLIALDAWIEVQMQKSEIHPPK